MKMCSDVNGYIAHEKCLNVHSIPDMEKVASMQAMLADSFRENCGHFWINNNFLAAFIHQCLKVYVIIHN